ncbi:1355_t:CDS:2 [Ambispora leptoticha]|uniref:1355_t:CDS:1 n=1 Tax=Ambispora leptoticha TaxID=144679 RepID=A0A9N9FLV3_9GLOM|nr:1355_t:CDS:2 [Ambispora leptoticha]
MLLLIRLAPYPYNILNTLLSATHISLRVYAIATAISLFKLVIHVWIGSKISSFTEHLKGNSDSSNFNEIHLDPMRIIPVMIGVSIGLGVIIYVWILARRSIKEVEENISNEMLEEGCGNEMKQFIPRRPSDSDREGTDDEYEYTVEDLPNESITTLPVEEIISLESNANHQAGILAQNLLEPAFDIQRRSSHSTSLSDASYRLIEHKEDQNTLQLNFPYTHPLIVDRSAVFSRKQTPTVPNLDQKVQSTSGRIRKQGPSSGTDLNHMVLRFELNNLMIWLLVRKLKSSRLLRNLSGGGGSRQGPAKILKINRNFQ